MKIDVEGAELKVWRGAQRTLRTYQPVVVFEHGLGGADCYGGGPVPLFEFLHACGLRVSLMHAWLAGAPPLDRAHFVTEFETGSNYYFVAHP